MKNKIVLNRHSELPLKEDDANLFLEIMTAIAVFLFAVTLSGYLKADNITNSWNNDISGSMTVQIMPAEKVLEKEDETLRVNNVIKFFENLPQVERVLLLGDKQMQKLMSPWLGTQADISELPLPKLLDVRFKQGMEIDYEKVTAALHDIAPYASIDSHRIWLNRLLRFASAIQTLALFILLLVLTASALSIFYATRTSLGIHQQIIEILHIMGATDDYIARQYAQRSFWIGLFSGIAGLLLGAAAIYIIGNMAQGLDSGLIRHSSLGLKGWTALISLPLWSAVLSMLTAYLTVKRVLGKMM